MKKLIIILTVVIISLNVNAQYSKNAPSYPDSIANHNPTIDSNNIPLLSVNDIGRLIAPLKSQITAQQYEDFIQIIQYLIATKQKELSQFKKK